MVAYYFSFKTALVKGSPNVVAPNTSVLIYDVADVNRVTPVTAYSDPGLTSIVNLVSDAYGIVPDFYTDNRPDVLWKSGAFKGQWATSQSRPGLRGPTGAKGDAGPQGAQGNPGLNGAGTNASFAPYVTASGPTREALDARYTPTDTMPSFIETHLPTRLEEGALDDTYASRAKALGQTVRAGTFNPALSLYGMNASTIQQIRNLVSRASSGGLLRVGFAADSIAAGQYLADRASTAWPTVTRNYLAALGIPTAGTGIVYCAAGSTSKDPRWNFTGAWVPHAPNNQYMMTDTPGQVATFTSDLPGAIAEVILSDFSGTCTISIDGGAAETVNASGGPTNKVWTKSGLADTTHTITVTTVAGFTYLAGAGVRRASGVVMDNGAVGGSTSADWAGTNFYDPMAVALTAQPNIMFIGLYTNDSATGVTPAAYKTSIETITARVRAAGAIPIYVANQATPTPNPSVAPFRGALYDLADTLTVPIVDIYERWGGTWEVPDSLGQMQDIYHPNLRGAADIGRAVANILAF